MRTKNVKGQALELKERMTNPAVADLVSRQRRVRIDEIEYAIRKARTVTVLKIVEEFGYSLFMMSAVLFVLFGALKTNMVVLMVIIALVPAVPWYYFIDWIRRYLNSYKDIGDRIKIINGEIDRLEELSGGPIPSVVSLLVSLEGLALKKVMIERSNPDCDVHACRLDQLIRMHGLILKEYGLISSFGPVFDEASRRWFQMASQGAVMSDFQI